VSGEPGPAQLRLFMGENLYEGRYTFVRELLQNSLDASRHREFVEHSRGNRSFAAEPIIVRGWTDRDGFRWVSVSDEGMGMTESIVTEYLLKAGSSYYNSPAFRADALRYSHDGRLFTPISRFGIGLLSCFVLGDRVEVATRRVRVGTAAEQSIRLSLSDLEGYYTVQVEPMAPAPMPCPAGDGPGYRRRPGTEVAVRLDARRETESLDLRALLQELLFCPPVPVEYEGEMIGGASETLVDQPRCQSYCLSLAADSLKEVERLLDQELPDGLLVSLLPLDLTANSPAEELRGQMILLYVASDIGRSADDSTPPAERIVPELVLTGLPSSEEFADQITGAPFNPESFHSTILSVRATEVGVRLECTRRSYGEQFGVSCCSRGSVNAVSAWKWRA